MQSFIILYRFFWVYKVDAGAKTGAWDRALVVLGIRVVSTNAFSGWFDLAEACWAILQEQEFDTIVVELEQVVWMLDRSLMIWKMFN